MANLSDLVRELLDADPHASAIEFNGRWYDWGSLQRCAVDVMAALDASGVAPCAPIAFVPRNHPAAIAALLALLAQGRSIRMVYAFQSATSLARAVADTGAAAMIGHAEDMSLQLRAVLETGAMAAIVLDGMQAAAAAGFELARSSTSDSNPATPQIEILTSGTTGAPKPFAISYSLIEQHFVSTPLTRSQGDSPLEAPPFLLYFPLGNISGIYSTLPTMLRRQRAVLLERFSISAWHDYVLRYRPSHSGVPPSCMQQLLDADIPAEDLASIKAMGVGAAPLDPAVQQAFEDRYGIPILLSYGATEFAGPVAMMTLELHARWAATKHGSVGQALPGCALRVVNADSGEVIPAGEEGLLEVVSPRVGPDWIRTADLAIIDSDGFLFLRGRADGAIMRGGFKVLPETVERALMLHPAVAEVAVVGVTDQRVGQLPAAAIRLKRGAAVLDIVALESHLRDHLLATQIPGKWLFCEDFPRNPSLKTDRPALRAMLERD